MPFRLRRLFNILPPAPLPPFIFGEALLMMQLIPSPTPPERRGANLLGQDENLHYEYTAEYEAGAGDVILEGW